MKNNLKNLVVARSEATKQSSQRRVWRWFLSVLFIVLPATARPAASSIVVWHSMTGEKVNFLQHFAEQFNALPENKGRYEVRLQFVGSYEDGLNKLRATLVVGRGPHIAQITDIGTQVLVDSQKVVPLGDLIKKDPHFPLKEILPQIRRYYEVNGKLFSLPFATSNPILYYDADAFARAGITHPPRSFAEMAEDARKLTDPKAKIEGLTWPLHSWFFEQFLAVQGVDFADHSNGRMGRATALNLTSPEAKAFVSLWLDMVKQGTFANVGRGWDPAEQSFLGGRARMLVTSTSEVFEVLRRVPFKLGTAPLPSRDGTKEGGTIIGGNSFWIFKGKPAGEQDAAYRYVKFMASKEVQKQWHMETGYFPIRADVIDELKAEGFYKKYPAAWTPIEQLRASPLIPATQGALLGSFPEVREYIESAIEEILTGKSTIDAALAQAKTYCDMALRRYNRLHPD